MRPPELLSVKVSVRDASLFFHIFANLSAKMVKNKEL